MLQPTRRGKTSDSSKVEYFVRAPEVMPGVGNQPVSATQLRPYFCIAKPTDLSVPDREDSELLYSGAHFGIVTHASPMQGIDSPSFRPERMALCHLVDLDYWSM